MAKEPSERADRRSASPKGIDRPRTRPEAISSYRSRHVTTPIHAVHRSFRWLLRNTHRAFRLLWWLCTGQFGRAGSALLPYYRRLIPVRIQTMVPYRLQESVARWLEKESAHTRPEVADREREYRATWLHENLANSSVVRIPGLRLRNPHSPTILVCAHAIGRFLYGAERSLLDLLEGFTANTYNVIVVIPNTNSVAYIRELTARSMAVVSFHYTWWHDNRPLDEPAIAVFEALIDQYHIDAVHVNTIMLREPLMAARRKRIPAIIHAREIITYDAELCERIGADAQDIVNEVATSADYIIANSRATAACYGKGDHIMVLPNTVDTDELDLGNDIDERQVFVGLVGSNLVKKGIYDFAELAQTLKDRAPNLRFVLVGPENQHTAALRRAQQRKGLYPNLVITGYVESPREAFSKVNIVVNLSHFQESFGRTVLEAMAARRAVVAYEWGAIPELVVHGETGYLVPYKNIEEVALHLERLAHQPSLISRMGEAGRTLATDRYSRQKFAESLQKAYARILGHLPGASNEHMHVRARMGTTTDVSVIIPNYNYAHYLPERLSSIINQTVRPREIIFLDDASSDNSVEVAQSILETSSIPYSIVRNESTAGTYRQWLRGIAEAKGELLWIAEADDTCEPDMLAALARALQDERVVISYCQSKRIDENGVVTAPDNLHHTDALDPQRWRHDYRELGVREVVDWLAYRNTIPNASACLLRKSAIAGIEEELARGRFCGDWLLYAHMLRHGDIAYIARPLNSFRRHSGTVTASRGKTTELLEELAGVRQLTVDHYPVHASQLPRMDSLLDKDYRVDGVTKNSDCVLIRPLLDAIAAQVRNTRRFAFITTNNGSFDGGSEVLWRECTKRLRSLGHDVVVLIKKWDPRPPFLYDFDRLGIKSHYKEEQGFEEIIGFKPDLVLISMGDQDEGIEYYGKLRSGGMSYVIINQLTKEPRFWPIRKDINDRVREGFIGAERVFFTCEHNHRVMEQRLKCELSRWTRHYNPCHTDPDVIPEFPPVSEGIGLAVPANIRFVHKGQDLLVEVMKQDKWKNRDVTINLYGVGEDENRLKEMVKKAGLEKRFVFHGKIVFVGREHEISQIWLRNQAILLPSRMEGLPIMLVGAMLSARVPVVTNIGGHAEVVEDGVAGFIASDPTPEALDEAMERAYQRRDEWEEIGLRAKQAILDYLPKDPIGDAVDKILEVVGP